MTKSKILIVDDELVICQSCAKAIGRRGHDVNYTTSGREALKLIDGEDFDIVFSDLKMMDLGGMEVLKYIKDNRPDTVVIIITGYATIASAVETMKIGAFDYLPKPFTAQELNAVLEKAIDKRRNLLISRKACRFGVKEDYCGLIGKSSRMQEVYKLIEKVAPTHSTVLIFGASGTGKELIARAIHARSERAGKPFVTVDCGTLSSNLLSSELFGYKKGAFTGADRDKTGLLESADGGTIFLDEISNIDPNVQTMLLRAIQEQSFIPLGSTKDKKVNVRMIFATNTDLKTMVDEGSFREDLYYRLYVFPISVPSLRDRKEDIPLLTYHFLKKYGQENKKKISISDQVMEKLIEFDWPGNVRQLENTIERMAILTEDDRLEVRHLPAMLFHDLDLNTKIPMNSDELKKAKKELREQSVEGLERAFVLEALKRNDWNVTRAADEVGMHRQNFQSLMRKYGVKSSA